LIIPGGGGGGGFPCDPFLDPEDCGGPPCDPFEDPGCGFGGAGGSGGGGFAPGDTGAKPRTFPWPQLPAFFFDSLSFDRPSCLNILNQCLEENEKFYQNLKDKQRREFEGCLIDCIRSNPPANLTLASKLAKCVGKCDAKLAGQLAGDFFGKAAADLACFGRFKLCGALRAGDSK